MAKRFKTHTGLKVCTTIVSLLLVAAIILTGCAFGLGWVQLAKTTVTDVDQVQDDTDDTNNEETTEDDNGGMVVGEGEEDGIALTMAKLSADEYAAYGVSTLAESAYTVTATITPSTAATSSLSWSLAWADGGSGSWSSGKTVTNYVTVSGNGLTATLSCLQEFGEQIILTCASTEGFMASATCTVDYLQKALGANFTFNFTSGYSDSSYSTAAYNWNFNYADSDVVVDFPYTTQTSSGSFNQYFVFVLEDTMTTSYTSYSWDKVYSSTYTIGLETTSYYTETVAITQEYYDLLNDLGYTLTCSPETYISGFLNGSTYKRYTLGALLLGNWTSNGYPSNYSEYLELVSAIADLGETPLFRIKYYYMSSYNDTLDDGTTQIYNISFSASSLNTIMNIALSDSSIVF